MNTGTLGQQHQHTKHGWRKHSWWVEKLEFGRKAGEGALYHCSNPNHQDDDASLKLDEDAKGNGLVFCHAGCNYSDILAGAEAVDVSAEPEVPAPEPVVEQVNTPRDRDPSDPRVVFSQKQEDGWIRWQRHTLVPQETWEKYGVKVVGDEVIFSWPSLGVEKRRRIGTKEFRWTHGLRPPCWPEFPETLPTEIHITEGETDCVVLRHLGLTAFAKVKGANTNLSVAVFEALRERGVTTVTLVPDADDPGLEGVRVDAATAQRAGLGVQIVGIGRLIDPLAGETDILDAYRQTDNPFALRRAIRESTSLVPETHLRRPITMADVPETVPDPDWLVEKIMERGGLGVITSDAGLGKSLLGLVIAGASSSGFALDHKLIPAMPVLLIDEESGDTVLFRRLRKLQENGFIANDANLTIHSLPRFNPFDREDLEWLRSEMVRTGAKLVILDNWVDFLHGNDENSNSLVQPILMAFRDLANEFDATIIILHHISKAGNYRGASALKGAVDWMLQIDSNRIDPNARRLWTVKSRHGPPVEVLYQMEFDALGLTGFYWLGKVTRVQPNVKKRTPTPQALFVMDYLIEHGSASKSDLRSSLPEGLTPAQLTNVIETLKKWKWINHLNEGVSGVEGVYDVSTLTSGEWGQFTGTEGDDPKDETDDGE